VAIDGYFARTTATGNRSITRYRPLGSRGAPSPGAGGSGAHRSRKERAFGL